MGAAYGHMNHIFEKEDMTFSDIEQIFKKAASGQLVGTRKTDGINIFLSYSVERGIVLTARNKTRDLKNGGTPADEMIKIYQKKEENGETFGPMKNVFSSAFDMFKILIQNLDVEEQKYYFGDNGDIWYNVEILNQEAKNVIKYDTNIIIFHQTGGGLLDRKTGDVTNVDLSKQISSLQNKILKIQKKYPYKIFPVQVDAIETLEKLSDKEILNNSLNQLRALYTSVGLNSNSTLTEFILAKLKPIINQKEKEFNVKISNDIKIFLVKRMFGVSISLTNIKKGLSKEQKEFVDYFESKDIKKDIFKEAIQPLEIIVTDFSYEMLKSLKSLFIIDQNKENQRIKQQLEKSIEFINQSGITEKTNELSKQLQKLKKVDDFSLGEEGFSFDWNGQIYKFTGKFAPINQILNLEKTMRSELERVRELSLTNSDLGREIQEKQKSGVRVGIVVGSFKPPHRGHIKLIENTANIVDKLFIIVSDPKSKENQRMVGTIAFPSFISEEMLKAYLKDSPNKDKIEIKIMPSPMDMVIDYISGNNVNLLPNIHTVSKIIIGFSEEDQLRYAPLVKYSKYDKDVNPQDYKKFGITRRTYFNVIKPEIDKKDTNGEITKKLSATKFRSKLLSAIKNYNLDELNEFFPENLSAREKLRFINLIKLEYEKGNKKEKLDDIIKEEVSLNYEPTMFYRG